jgi:hypothetical protein
MSHVQLQSTELLPLLKRQMLIFATETDCSKVYNHCYSLMLKVVNGQML